MDYQIDWAALPVLAELFGVPDMELFINELVAIREHVKRTARLAHGN